MGTNHWSVVVVSLHGLFIFLSPIFRYNPFKVLLGNNFVIRVWLQITRVKCFLCSGRGNESCRATQSLGLVASSTTSKAGTRCLVHYL
ncbi:hypothetical protein Rcae01_06351 [Novipirellula caenicola]|uniref:Secreted protein n=1 Tax=Novipirellula caenicola TaxID=1536901 RepID=A0ABP9W0C5_9BACT